MVKQSPTNQLNPLLGVYGFSYDTYIKELCTLQTTLVISLFQMIAHDSLENFKYSFHSKKQSTEN